MILKAKAPNFANARVAQIMTSFVRKALILNPYTPNFAPALAVQIMNNFCLKLLILNAIVAQINHKNFLPQELHKY